jgi:hypothetical protein
MICKGNPIFLIAYIFGEKKCIICNVSQKKIIAADVFATQFGTGNFSSIYDYLINHPGREIKLV